VGRFILRRLLQAAVTILLAVLIVHISVTVLPGDPVRALFGIERPPPGVVEAIREQYHLNDPYLVQFARYLWDVLTLRLGRSLRFGGMDVRAIVSASWVPTAWLVGLALTLQVVVGIAAGVIGTVRDRTWTARAITAVAALMLTVPIVLTAPALHWLLTIQWALLPVNSTSGGWVGYTLPVVVLAAMTMGSVILLLRSELLQTLRTPFIAFARANGIGRGRLVGVHALRSALPPVVSYLSANLGFVVVGVLLVESLMGVRGLGAVLFTAIRFQDRSVVVSVVLVITIVVVLLNALADVVVALLDPRAREGLDVDLPL
jgi:oligopeptide transport system permease protein